MLLSYMYIFIDWKSTEVGAGDLATGPYETGLTRGKYHIPFTQYYVDTQTLLTNMYNVMVNGSLPISIFEFPLPVALCFFCKVFEYSALLWF